jgi:uncharacterized RDD family membrane protein YckC
MTTRCIRCGRDIEGIAQYCGDCAAELAEASSSGPQPEPTEWERSQGIATAPPVAVPPTPGLCPNCGTSVSLDAAYCGICGAQIREGPRQMEYAGFWMRFLAVIIDGIVLGVVQGILSLMIDDQSSLIGINFLISFAYTVGFTAAEGATPGKMAVGCKIVAEDGSDLSIGRAIGRFFANILNAFTLGFGYLLIAFTPEKRGIHDYVAGTVVVKTR